MIDAAPVAASTSPASVADWDSQLASLLQDLSSVQGDLLAVLAEKRRVILSGEAPALPSLQTRETDIVQRLDACHQRRRTLLSQAQASGLPSNSLTDLAKRVSPGAASTASRDLKAVGLNMRKLQSESLSNWVLAQRSLLHVSQLLEIIATGGRIQPTYEKDAPSLTRGNLVDSEA